MEIKKVGVVGCGLMGRGIAQVSAQAKYRVLVSEVSDELLDKGLKFIDSMLSKDAAKGRISPADKTDVMGRISGTTSLKDFADCDIVIEAVREDMAAKKPVFAELDAVCPAHVILASNTSCLSIIEIATATKRADKVLGTHFTNPVPVNRMLELVKSIATSQDTLNTARAFGESIGQTVVIAEDTPGFIGNRLLIPYLLNAIRMLEAKLATREDIDAVARTGLAHPMGPFVLADFIGNDTVFFIASAMYDALKDPLYAPPPLLRQMVTAGWLGRKTGRGFYEYDSTGGARKT